MRQMNFDELGKEVDLLSRFTSEEYRKEYRKESIWPDGKIPDLQAKQNQPYLEWPPNNSKTKAIQIIYSGGGYGGNNPDSFGSHPPALFKEKE